MKTYFFPFLCCLTLLSLTFLSCKKSPDKKQEASTPTPRHITLEGEIVLDSTLKLIRGSSLKIMPGTKITFKPGAKIMTWGDVTMKGTPQNRIQLIGINPKHKKQILQVYGETNFLHVHHTDVKNGLIINYMSDVHFKDVHFSSEENTEWKEAMLRILKSKVLIEDCVIDWNNSGEGIIIHKSDNPVVRNCSFSKLPDAVEYIHLKNGLISNCTFDGNLDDSVDFNHCFNIRVENCTFTNIQETAMELGSQGMGVSDSLVVDNCLFVDCQTALHLKESTMLQMSNCTFINNETSIDLVSNKDSLKHTTLYLSNSIIKGGKNFISEKEGAKAIIKNTVVGKDIRRKDVTVLDFEFTKSGDNDYQINSENPAVLRKLEGLGFKK